jgi:outer membrane protein OmpA-like peptidoglycan-associated protein
MKFVTELLRSALGIVLLGCFTVFAQAQEGLGPFMPHDGGTLTTAWGNAYGPDAESWIRFSKVGSSSFDINYSSSRGTVAVRRIRTIDRDNGRAIVLGYSPKMPLIIENSTTLGISTAVLMELRNQGQSRVILVHNEGLATMQGVLTRLGSSKMEIDVEGELLPVPVLQARGQFTDGRRKAEGDLWFLDNRNNPVLLQYNIQFTGEKVPRTERVVRVTAGASERMKLEQALAARRLYTTYGIHFDFDKSTIRNSSNPMLNEIATAMNNNPLWTLQITGHTDSIGKNDYNLKLSQKRAESVRAALIKRGVAPNRLTTSGMGASDPVATNKTLQGRALNRRVVLARTDR